MLHLAKSVLTADFLLLTKKGLLLIFDEQHRRTHLGWINEACLEGKRITFSLGLTVKQVHGETEWEEFDTYSHVLEDLDTFACLDDFGGYHCSDSSLQEPTVRIYPAASIPGDHDRNHQTLIEYGERIR